MKFDSEGEGIDGIVIAFDDLLSPVEVKINGNGLFIMDTNRIYMLYFNWLKKIIIIFYLL